MNKQLQKELAACESDEEREALLFERYTAGGRLNNPNRPELSELLYHAVSLFFEKPALPDSPVVASHAQELCGGALVFNTLSGVGKSTALSPRHLGQAFYLLAECADASSESGKRERFICLKKAVEYSCMQAVSPLFDCYIHGIGTEVSAEGALAVTQTDVFRVYYCYRIGSYLDAIEDLKAAEAKPTAEDK